MNGAKVELDFVRGHPFKAEGILTVRRAFLTAPTIVLSNKVVTYIHIRVQAVQDKGVIFIVRKVSVPNAKEVIKGVGY